MDTPTVVQELPDGLLQYGDRQYRCVRGSDVQRDGMYLEISEGADFFGAQVAEVFFSDATGEFSLSLFVPDVPLPMVDWLIDRARQWLPPKDA